MTHHWLVRRRGGERVLEALGELVPDAPIHTIVHNPDFRFEPDDASREIHTSLLQYVPHAPKIYPKLLPLMPKAVGLMKLPDVDLVLCSDACIAKAMRPADRSKVVCYCHSPVRYAWEHQISDEYRQSLPAPLRFLWEPTMRKIREIDYESAQRVDLFIANSHHVAQRIQKFYSRDSVVVYPPVEIADAPVMAPREDFLLCVGHHVPYKRLDLAVEACRELGRRLVVIGEGPDIKRLKLAKQPHVEYLGWQTNESIRDHFARAAGLLFCGEEDFGIVPVEAMSFGCPVVAYAVGGARETVVPGQTGFWFEAQTTEAVVDAIHRLGETSFDPAAMHDHTTKFSRDRFIADIRTQILSVL